MDRRQDTRSGALRPGVGGQETRYKIRSPQTWAGWTGDRIQDQEPSDLGWVDRRQDARSGALRPGLGGQETGYKIRSPQSWAGWTGDRIQDQEPSDLGWVDRRQDTRSGALSPGLGGRRNGMKDQELSCLGRAESWWNDVAAAVSLGLGGEEIR